MQRITIYNTPILSPILRVLARVSLRAIGWQSVGQLPSGVTKCVFTAAPHTTNWDFPLFLAIVFDLKLTLHVMIKHTFFWWPLGAVMRYCGAIPVNRTKNPGAVINEIAREFARRDNLMLVITPEGTRKPRRHWKVGFYRIAQAAQVPIIVGYMDTRTRTGGVSDLIIHAPTSADSADVAAAMARIYAFYDDKQGICPQNYDSPNRPT